MKKGLLYISFLGILCLTGCGNKTLKCFMVNDANMELKINQDIVIDFKNDKMAKMNMTTSVTLSDNYSSYADELNKNLKQEYQKYDNKEGLEVKISKKSEKIVLTFSADLNKMSDETKEQFDIVGPGQTLDEVKNDLEKQGYSCKEA